MDTQMIEALKLVLEACRDVGGDAAMVAIFYFCIPLISTFMYVIFWIIGAIMIKRVLEMALKHVFPHKEPEPTRTPEEHMQHIEAMGAEARKDEAKAKANEQSPDKVLNQFCLENLGVGERMVKWSKVKEYIHDHPSMFQN